MQSDAESVEEYDGWRGRVAGFEVRRADANR